MYFSVRCVGTKCDPPSVNHLPSCRVFSGCISGPCALGDDRKGAIYSVYTVVEIMSPEIYRSASFIREMRPRYLCAFQFFISVLLP